MTTARRLAHSGAFWILLCYGVTLPLFFRPVLHGVDPVGYFVWLRSAVVDHNLDVANEFEDLGIYRDFNYQNITLPTGYRYNQWSSGPALLWTPAYAPVHALLTGLHAAGVPVAPDGYGVPYTLATAFATTLYGLAGIFLLFRVARKYTGELPAALGVITVWLASPLLFYMYSSPFMSHTLDFFVNALFLWTWEQTRPAARWTGWVRRGAALGLAIVIRVQNVFLIVIPAVYLIWQLFQHATPMRSRLLHLLSHGVAFSGGLMLFVGPLMLFWKTVYGSWIYNTYAITNQLDGIHADFLRPHLWQLAFSNDHGLFFWSPVLLVALVGMVVAWRTDHELSAVILGAAILHFYFVSSLTTWNGGGPSFGARLLSGSLPYYAVGMAFAVAALHRWIRLRYLAILCGVFVLWNMLLLVQYALGSIPRGADRPAATDRRPISGDPGQLAAHHRCVTSTHCTIAPVMR
ncbi:MAG: glycosyltransferase family 39 protein [Anaerolineales bacterium]|nr:glycosyltransferase family 39 protein [Anaerolineales bacterium]